MIRPESPNTGDFRQPTFERRLREFDVCGKKDRRCQVLWADNLLKHDCFFLQTIPLPVAICAVWSPKSDLKGLPGEAAGATYNNRVDDERK